MKQHDSRVVVAFLAFAACATVALTGCGSEPTSAYNPDVVNEPDNFSMQVSGATHLTETYSYEWPNSGSAATVELASTVNAGAATLTIQDAFGAEVYGGSLALGGSLETASGQAGPWTIRIAFADFSGNVDLSVAKK